MMMLVVVVVVMQPQLLLLLVLPAAALAAVTSFLPQPRNKVSKVAKFSVNIFFSIASMHSMNGGEGLFLGKSCSWRKVVHGVIVPGVTREFR